MLKWLLFWVYKVDTTETHQSKSLLFSKGTLAVTDKWLQKSRKLYLMHSTPLHYKEFRKQIYKTSYLRLWLRPSAEGLIFWNENFNFNLMSRIWNTLLQMWQDAWKVIFFLFPPSQIFRPFYGPVAGLNSKDSLHACCLSSIPRYSLHSIFQAYLRHLY